MSLAKPNPSSPRLAVPHRASPGPYLPSHVKPLPTLPGLTGPRRALPTPDLSMPHPDPASPRPAAPRPAIASKDLGGNSLVMLLHNFLAALVPRFRSVGRQVRFLLAHELNRGRERSELGAVVTKSVLLGSLHERSDLIGV